MAKISIHKQHSMPRKELESLAEELQDELSHRYGCACTRIGDEIEIKRSGITGTLKLQDDRVDIDIVLGPMLGMLAKRIEPAIRKKLDEHLD